MTCLYFIYVTESTDELIVISEAYVSKYYEQFDLMVFTN